MLTLYGIKSCDSCRKARKFLTEKGVEFRFHDVRDEGLDAAMLQRWAHYVDWETLFNRKSLSWRKIPEVDRSGLNQRACILADHRSANAAEAPDTRIGGFPDRRRLSRRIVSPSLVIGLAAFTSPTKKSLALLRAGACSKRAASIQFAR